ncbi:MAG: nitroreductase family protein [candidate division Zixibacteria bacterium]|nr:nitroreductase family protein [candidate division Zixibacteria bacterium]
MDAIEAIHTRRSIRKFTDRPVAPEMIEKLLRAAMAAPSANNQQPWQFVVIDDRAILDRVPDVHPYAAMCRQAPVSVLVCGDKNLDEDCGFWVQDCSAATQNLLLAAHALGLAAVWTGFYPIEERVVGMRKLLGLPENIIPLALVPIGYGAEKKPREDRYRPDRVHHNGW